MRQRTAQGVRDETSLRCHPGHITASRSVLLVSFLEFPFLFVCLCPVRQSRSWLGLALVPVGWASLRARLALWGCRSLGLPLFVFLLVRFVSGCIWQDTRW